MARTDDVQAGNWYLKAAEAGNRSGMNNFGCLYEKGIGGFPQNTTEAIAWYRKAAT